VSNVQLDDNIRIWLLEEEGFKSAPESRKCWRWNNVFGQSIPDPRSRNIEGPTTDCSQSEHRHHQATGAGRAVEAWCFPAFHPLFVNTFRVGISLLRAWTRISMKLAALSCLKFSLLVSLRVSVWTGSWETCHLDCLLTGE